MTFNLNETVRVRLTDLGRAIYRDYYGGRIPPRVDPSGLTAMPMHELMRIFGPHVGPFRPQVLSMDIEIPERGKA